MSLADASSLPLNSSPLESTRVGIHESFWTTARSPQMQRITKMAPPTTPQALHEHIILHHVNGALSLPFPLFTLQVLGAALPLPRPTPARGLQGN